MSKTNVQALCLQYYMQSVKNYPPKISLNDIMKEIEKTNELNNQFTKKDLQSFMRILRYRIKYSKPHDNDLKSIKQIIKHKFDSEPKNHIFYFKCGSASEFRSGYVLGNGVFYSEKNLPRHIKKRIKSSKRLKNKKFEREIEKNIPSRSHIDEILRRNKINLDKNLSYMKISVRSIGVHNAYQKAIQEFKRNHNILKFIQSGTHYREDETISFDAYGHTAASRLAGAFSARDIVNNAYLHKNTSDNSKIRIVNKIFNKKNPTDLESSILEAIDIYGMIEKNTPIQVKFLLVIIALETILSNKDNKRGSTKNDFSERISFLISNRTWWKDDICGILSSENHSTRGLQAFKMSQELYKYRSELAHGQSPQNPNNVFENYKLAEKILYEITFKLINLSKKYPTKKDLDDYFLKLKFKQ